jgi:DNA polymerase-3 subunit beta
MKITATAAVLSAQLGWVTRVLPARPAIPVLAGVRIEVAEDRVYLAATDYDTWAQAALEADTEGEGVVVLPGRLLASLVAQLPGAHLLTLDIAPDQVRISCGPTRASLRTLPAEDYPAPPERPDPVGQADAAEMASALGQVHAAASTDPTLIALTGIHLQFDDGGLLMAATDTYRFARSVLGWEPTLDTVPDTPLLVPREALSQAVRAMTGTVSIGLQAEDAYGVVGLSLSDGTRHLSTRLIDKEFVNIDRTLALLEEETVSVSVDTSELAAAIRRTRLFAHDATPVRIEIGDGELVVRAGADGDSSADTVTAEVDGDPTALAFQPAFLLDALTSSGSERVRLGVSHPHKPVLVQADDEEVLGYVHIVMPVRQ